MINKWLLVLAAALSAASLTACSGSKPDPAPSENDESATMPSPAEDLSAAPNAAADPATTVDGPARAEKVPVIDNSVAEVPSEEAPAPDEQMMDDAAATGMTARTMREDSAETEATPAEQTEAK